MLGQRAHAGPGNYDLPLPEPQVMLGLPVETEEAESFPLEG